MLAYRSSREVFSMAEEGRMRLLTERSWELRLRWEKAVKLV
jgi:hypothetical protein